MDTEDKKSPVFKVGDTVTYKDRNKLPNGKYRFSGNNHAGFKGIIKSYSSYYKEHKCFSITVTSTLDYHYDMLESEFEEYDTLSKEYDKPSNNKVKLINNCLTFLKVNQNE